MDYHRGADVQVGAFGEWFHFSYLGDQTSLIARSVHHVFLIDIVVLWMHLLIKPLLPVENAVNHNCNEHSRVSMSW